MDIRREEIEVRVRSGQNTGTAAIAYLRCLAYLVSAALDSEDAPGVRLCDQCLGWSLHRKACLLEGIKRAKAAVELVWVRGHGIELEGGFVLVEALKIVADFPHTLELVQRQTR